jgi:hypothetical protein
MNNRGQQFLQKRFYLNAEYAESAKETLGIGKVAVSLNAVISTTENTEDTEKT